MLTCSHSEKTQYSIRYLTAVSQETKNNHADLFILPSSDTDKLVKIEKMINSETSMRDLYQSDAELFHSTK